ncbi:carbohydrate ABC transporter permease [Paraburkholderia rhizosphaerae]|uniref:Carbohydrate ABC transporter membrane protein 1 (CUT1 family) n=1 Tax=Paraburkholderia rhizosphaerae TaxID=480658 RepID=A0A4R8M0G7_9BURK|nr:sugar ABC transporter permease [Paraburkholderia rhizosphaerae]TDY54755.1 carbohydrate ABC transporter membrane protein 1 (CUT1 family) [Paraburkholderia rhizosphaerae]
MNIALSAESERRRRLRVPSQTLVAAAFLAPAVLLLAVFLLYPLVSSMRLSLLDWNGLGTDARYVGFSNWVHLVHDGVFWLSLWNNAILAVISVVVELPIALALAVLLEKAGRGSRLLKVLYFLPLLMSSVAIGVLFKNIYDPNFGPLNAALRATGLGALAQDWLGDPHLSLASTIAVICWQNIPFYMILFLAGLSSMPVEVVEAARLEGASGWVIFWRIKLPHLQGTVRTAVLLAVLGSLRYFDLIYVMTGGGPENASELMATYMYRTVFSSFQLGYGSTIGSAMFIIVCAVAAVSLRFTRRYATEV